MKVTIRYFNILYGGVVNLVLIELLQNFSLTTIIIFVVLLGLAIKGVVDFYDWATARAKKSFTKHNRTQALQERLDKNEELFEEYIQSQKKNHEDFKKMAQQINLLIASDKDDIKGYITEKYHYYVEEKGWIDNYTLDCIEKRYQHYQAEGGNSFVENLVSRIRLLPNVPPNKEEERKKES